MKVVLEGYEKSRRTYGYRRIQIWIEREHGIKINHKAILRLMRKLNIRSVARKRNPYRLIQNQYGSIHTYPNLLRQNFTAKQPNEKWGTDITYIPTQQGFVYLAVIKDFLTERSLAIPCQETCLLKWFCKRFVWQLLMLNQSKELFSKVIRDTNSGPLPIVP